VNAKSSAFRREAEEDRLSRAREMSCLFMFRAVGWFDLRINVNFDFTSAGK
jgi:hypothetical protein